MDNTLNTIVKFYHSQAHQNTGPSVFEEFKRRWIDVAGVALAAMDQRAYLIAKQMVQTGSYLGPCQLIGTSLTTQDEMAAFTNGVMIRCLDGADTYPGGGGHPSDCWAALLALGQEHGSSLDELCASLIVAYDFYWRFFKASALRNHGLDNTCYVSFSSALGGAHLLGLDEQSMAHALSMVVSSSLSLGVARSGALSMWKSAASGYAAKQGVFAARLASLGMTAPSAPFEGERGLWGLTHWPELDTTNPLPALNSPFQLAHMKYFVCEYHCQTPIMAAIELAREVGDQAIESVTISTYQFALQEVGSGQEKWRPLTRETADHSMPWSVAAVLIDGAFSLGIYEPARLQDPQILALAQRIVIQEDPLLSASFPESTPCVMEIKTQSGQTYRAQINRALGHPLNPMSTQEVMDKFRQLNARRLRSDQIDAFLKRIDHLRPTDTVNELFASTVFE